MKNLVFIFIAGTILAGCSSSKETAASKSDRKAAEMEAVIRAVESRRYIIKMDKIYMQGGGVAELVPKNNFFIMNGEIASVSLAYLGRSYFIRPISGINFNGQTVRYEMQSNSEKGLFDIQVEVVKGGDKFNFFITIGTSGYCSVSLNNPYIESVSYRGTLVPLTQKQISGTMQKENI